MQIRYMEKFAAGWFALEKRLLPSYVWTSDPLTLWRERILFIICLIAAVLGPIALVPSLLLAYSEGLWSVILIDSLSYIVVVIILIARNSSFVIRALAIYFILYALGVALLFILGPAGAGYIWLFGSSVLISTFIGLGAVIWTLALNMIAFLSVGIFVAYGNPEWKIHVENVLEVWLVMSVNFILLNALIAITMAFMLDGLKKALQAEQKISRSLRESEERWKFALEGAGDGLWDWDVVINRLYYSKQWKAMLGYADNEIGDTFDEWKSRIHPEDKVATHSELERHLRRETETYQKEYRFLCKDGSYKWILDRGKVIEWTGDGKPRRFIGTHTDITERKRAEEEKRKLEERLNRAEKMESLGILAGGVAHDLNNVLGVVVGYAELLLLKTKESSAIRPQLMEIMRGGQRSAAIVQDLLTLARRGVSARSVLNLNSIISDCQKSPEFDHLASFHSSVKIETELESDLPNMTGSSIHLGKTIFNLISNASEAMPKGGMLTIKTSNQYLDRPIHGYDEIREGEYAVLSVSDTGEGIHAADLKRIFEPFYTKKVMGRSGTGLGLAVVWGTVKDHNGYINVESEEGKGSTFTLYFPVTREELSAETVAVSISEYMGKGESILVVDDVKEQRALAAEMLRKLNYSVSGVSSGEEAVAYLKEHKVDLMVLDMIMEPGIDGLETYRRVLENNPRQKAVIVSGFSETDRVQKVQEMGARAFVSKPYILENIGSAIKKEIDRK